MNLNEKSIWSSTPYKVMGFAFSWTVFRCSICESSPSFPVCALFCITYSPLPLSFHYNLMDLAATGVMVINDLGCWAFSHWSHWTDSSLGYHCEQLPLFSLPAFCHLKDSVKFRDSVRRLYNSVKRSLLWLFPISKSHTILLPTGWEVSPPENCQYITYHNTAVSRLCVCMCIHI